MKPGIELRPLSEINDLPGALMLQPIFIAASLLVLVLVVWGVCVRSQFLFLLATMEKAVQAPRTDSSVKHYLPSEIRALAGRLGAKADGKASFVTFHQIGRMWRAPGAKPMRFRARQSNALTVPDYISRADFEPFSSFTAVDYSVNGKAGLEVRIGCMIPMVHEVGTAAILRGELMRYLAELPLAPDAIIANRCLDWRVVDQITFVVGQGVGAARAEVTLRLGPEGFVENIETASRPAQVGKTVVDRPWGGRFWKYEMHHGRMVPMRAEVYWVVDGRRFIYWQAQITDWTLVSSAAREGAGTTLT